MPLDITEPSNLTRGCAAPQPSEDAVIENCDAEVLAVDSVCPWSPMTQSVAHSCRATSESRRAKGLPKRTQMLPSEQWRKKMTIQNTIGVIPFC